MGGLGDAGLDVLITDVDAPADEPAALRATGIEVETV
jgi:hypothetical protein